MSTLAAIGLLNLCGLLAAILVLVLILVFLTLLAHHDKDDPTGVKRFGDGTITRHTRDRQINEEV